MCFYTGDTGAVHILDFDTKASPVETQTADVKVAEYQREDKHSIHSWLTFLICWATEKFGQTTLEQSNPIVSRTTCLNRLQYLFLWTNHSKRRPVEYCTIYNYVLVLFYIFDKKWQQIKGLQCMSEKYYISQREVLISPDFARSFTATHRRTTN